MVKISKEAAAAYLVVANMGLPCPSEKAVKAVDACFADVGSKVLGFAAPDIEDPDQEAAYVEEAKGWYAESIEKLCLMLKDDGFVVEEDKNAEA